MIHRDATGGMRIDPYRAYLKKDGAIGRNFREYREGTAFAQRKFLTSEDAALLGRLGYFEESIWPRHYDWPDGEELIGLVRGIVETGRARAGDIHGMALSWAEPRRCELTWTAGEAGRQHVAARDEAGSPVTLLPFPTPLFVDPETGEIGVAETGLPARLASWFAAAPPVEHGSIHAVAAKLSRIGQHAPVPRLHRVEERQRCPSGAGAQALRLRAQDDAACLRRQADRGGERRRCPRLSVRSLGNPLPRRRGPSARRAGRRHRGAGQWGLCRHPARPRAAKRGSGKRCGKRRSLMARRSATCCATTTAGCANCGTPMSCFRRSAAGRTTGPAWGSSFRRFRGCEPRAGVSSR